MEETENQVLADAVMQAVSPQDVSEGISTVVVPKDHRVVVLSDEAALPNPKRKTGTATFYDADGLAAYVNRHKSEASLLYMDARETTIQAVLNDHGAEDAGWADHVARLSVRKTDAWTRWLANNETLSDQEAFAEHIERNLIDIVEPNGADLLELAQTIQATTKVDFRSSRLLANGQRQLEYTENVETAGGQRGEIIIPKEFTLGIAPFEGTDLYKITARLRIRIVESHLRIAYILDNPQDVEREAFNDIADRVKNATDVEVVYGHRTLPAAPKVIRGYVRGLLTTVPVHALIRIRTHESAQAKSSTRRHATGAPDHHRDRRRR